MDFFAPQDENQLVFGQSKHHVFRKLLNVVPDLPVEVFGLVAIDAAYLFEEWAEETETPIGKSVQSNFFCKKIQHFDRKIQQFCKIFRALACFSGLYRASFEEVFNGC